MSVAFAAFGGDPRLRIGPEQPHPGGKLTISYDPKAGALEKSDTFILVYGFTSFENKRAPLQPQNGRFTAEIALPADAVYFWCWVEGKTPDERDTNRGAAWDTYLYDASGMPVQGARALRASILGVSKQRLDTNTVQLILIEEELRAFPQSARARADWWTLRFEDAGRTNTSRESLLHDIGVFFDSHLDQPWAYQAAALGYNHLNRNQQSIEVIRAFSQRFPSDPRCDGLILDMLGNFGTEADLEALPRGSSRWAANRSYWSTLLNSYERSHAGPQKLLQAGRELLALTPAAQDDLGQTRYRTAETWLANGVDTAAAEKVARESLAISETGPKLEMTANVAVNPKVRKSFILAIHRSTLGWALFLQGRYQEALVELRHAVEIRDKEKYASRAVYYRLGQTLEKLGRPAQAMDAYAKELAWGDLEEPTRAAITELYRSRQGTLDGLNDSISNRVNDLLAQSAAAEPIEEMNAKPGRFDLRGPDGQPVQLGAYQDKVVIVEFWASWCGPCLKSLEHTRKLTQKFPGQTAVLAVAVDDEETRPRAVKYLKEHAYPFTLLFDDESRRDLPVVSVPARFLIDGQGLLRVHESGWSPEQDLVFEKKLAAVLAAAR
jgi:thiol-disulfide isomerase/thioredoxin